MDFKPFIIDPLTLVSGEYGEIGPFLIVDLAALPDDIASLILPPCPLIGLGNHPNPLASRVDLRVETPATLAGVAASIGKNPMAAAILVQLLRAIEGQSLEAALVKESMAYGLLQGGDEHRAWLAARTPGEPVPPGEIRLDRVGDRLDLLLDRPAARNAIDRPMRDALHEGFMLAALDDSIEAVTLRGMGKAFSVGADLDEFGTTRDPVEAHRIRMATLPAHAIIRCRDRLTVHVQGACVGAGLEMAAFAARVTATPDAWFQLPELAMGLLPGAGGCVSVSRRIGRQRAALMMLTGKRINAQTALSWGLVDEVVGE